MEGGKIMLKIDKQYYVLNLSVLRRLFDRKFPKDNEVRADACHKVGLTYTNFDRYMRKKTETQNVAMLAPRLFAS